MSDYRIIEGDCIEGMATLPEQSVQTCVTSPPYWGLRDYGHGDQLGLEPTPDEYVANMVRVFAEVRRVLRDDGTLWLNLGDSYAATTRSAGASILSTLSTKPTAAKTAAQREQGSWRTELGDGLKPKDLVGIPWAVAFALRADGWYLRSDIIWAKPNPMPESVTDRPTKAHEYLFLLSKSPRYFYDHEAIRETATTGDHPRTVFDNTPPTPPGTSPHSGLRRQHPSNKQDEIGAQRVKGGDRHSGFNARWKDSARAQTRRAVELAEDAGLTQEHLDAIRSVGITDTGKATVTQDGTGKNAADVQALADEAKEALGGYYREFLIPLERNRRSVWNVATMPFAGAHFATFPPKLIEPCILAGSRPPDARRAGTESKHGGPTLATAHQSTRPCSPSTVLDPFAGSGTTGVVALRHDRDFIGCELNPEYAQMARHRIADDAPLLNTEAA